MGSPHLREAATQAQLEVLVAVVVLAAAEEVAEAAEEVAEAEEVADKIKLNNLYDFKNKCPLNIS